LAAFVRAVIVFVEGIVDGAGAVVGIKLSAVRETFELASCCDRRKSAVVERCPFAAMGSLFALSGEGVRGILSRQGKRAEGRFQENMKPDLSKAFVTM
jgi:hypothetical protein